MNRLIFILFIIFAPALSVAQKQLILLKNEKVRLRLYIGDEIIFKMKGAKSKRISYVSNVFDTAVMVHNTIVPFHRIERIYFKQGNFLNVVGGLLVVGGAGYFLIDQLNASVIKGDPSLDEGVTRSSAVMVGVGLPLMLMRKKSQRIGGKYRLRLVDEGSIFYRKDIRQQIGL